MIVLLLFFYAILFRFRYFIFALGNTLFKWWYMVYIWLSNGVNGIHFYRRMASYKRQRKPKGKSRMDNPETLETLSTQDTRRRQTKQKTQHRKLKRWTTRTSQNTGGELMCLQRVERSCHLEDTCHIIPIQDVLENTILNQIMFHFQNCWSPLCTYHSPKQKPVLVTHDS